ncbi:hypothetical protein T12_5666 [Trichinella patagoniensis]|uniref:Uncharacterized protein n=1 Tax=Trichinella patagoniensis TaxID=990121 RepID=A0A0V1A983_9BILA|nr:hypothetical protein T12_5666 [Trichinella patagoniensis]
MSTNRSVSFIQWRRAPQRPSSNRIWPNVIILNLIVICAR